MTHQCHDVIGQVPSQVRGHKTRQASKGNTCVVLVGTAEILQDKKVKIGTVGETENAGRGMKDSQQGGRMENEKNKNK